MSTTSTTSATSTTSPTSTAGTPTLSDEVDALLRRFLEAMPLPAIGVSPRGEVILWNGAAERSLGWQRDEVLGKANPTIPADRKDEFLRIVADTTEGRIHPHVETRRLRKDGTEFECTVTAAPLRDTAGRIIGGVAVLHDVTFIKEAQRSAEERFRALVHSIPNVAVLIVTADGLVQDGNRGAEVLLGRKSPGSAFADTYVAAERAQAHTDLTTALRLGVSQRERPVSRSDGSSVWADVIISSSRRDASNCDLVVVITDASMRKLMRDELQTRSLMNAAVSSFAQGALVERNLDALARTAVEHLATAVHAEVAALFRQSPSGELTLLHAFPAEDDIQACVSEDIHELAEAAVGEQGPVFRDAIGGVRGGAAVAVRSEGDVFVFATAAGAPLGAADSAYPLLSIAATFSAAWSRRTAEDALEIRESRMRMLFEHIPAIVSFMDTSRTFTDVQGAGLASAGFKADELVGKRLDEIEEDPPATPYVEDALHGKGTRWDAAFAGRLYDTRTEPVRDRDGSVIGVVHLAVDVTEQRRNEQSLHESREQLRRLSAARAEVQEEERRRVAREVHDEMGQRLTALRFDLDLLRRDIRAAKTEAAETRITDMFELVDETIRTVRRVATELRPAVLDDFGFRAAVEQELQTFSARTGVEATLQFRPTDLELEPSRATALYRIIQEALTNVARHAQAHQVLVRVSMLEGSVHAEIVDDGRGITPAEAESSSTLGVIGMRERAYALGGSAVVERYPGGGTRVAVVIPA